MTYKVRLPVSLTIACIQRSRNEEQHRWEVGKSYLSAPSFETSRRSTSWTVARSNGYEVLRAYSTWVKDRSTRSADTVICLQIFNEGVSAICEQDGRCCEVCAEPVHTRYLFVYRRLQGGGKWKVSSVGPQPEPDLWALLLTSIFNSQIPRLWPHSAFPLDHLCTSRRGSPFFATTCPNKSQLYCLHRTQRYVQHFSNA